MRHKAGEGSWVPSRMTLSHVLGGDENERSSLLEGGVPLK